MSNRQRLTFAAIAAVIAVVALVALSGGSDETEQTASTPATTATATAEASATPTAEATEAPEPEIQEIEVKGGEVVGGEADIDVKEGEKVRFSVVSDVADEIHVHGYDVMKDVEAGGTATFDFPAKIPGVFEVELEGIGLSVARLRVSQ